MHTFPSLAEAQSVVSSTIDQPVTSLDSTIKQGLYLSRSTIEMEDGTFTNSYDLRWNRPGISASIVAFDELTSPHEFMANSRCTAASSGGFFYLADRSSASPRELALNLSIANGTVRSLPIVDREAVLADHNSIHARMIASLGYLSLNGCHLSWSGSFTGHATDSKVYGNGNVRIDHQPDPLTGTARVLHEESRYTPEINDDVTDIGFIGSKGGEFVGKEKSQTGGIDIFAHDFVLRCPSRYVKKSPKLRLHNIGDITLANYSGGAFSAGPSFSVENFPDNPINQDASLGNRPPFINVRMARTVLYKTTDGYTHIRLFDGRPGSTRFPGITPAEAVQYAKSDKTVEWGCFLDPGQTAKLCVSHEDRLESYGNRHYLQWPTTERPGFTWIPEVGRSVANVIALY